MNEDFSFKDLGDAISAAVLRGVNRAIASNREKHRQATISDELVKNTCEQPKKDKKVATVSDSKADSYIEKLKRTGMKF